MTIQRRVHERYALELPVTLIHAAGETQGTTRNVSLGGALVGLGEHTIAFGSQVTLRVFLPSLKEEASLASTVRWLAPGAVGLQFGSLRAKEVWALNQMFKDAPTV
jgi:hypothetical protein